MVEWDARDRGIELGDGSTTRGLVLHCLECQHHVCWAWAEVFRFATPSDHGRDVARRLRCTQCGERKGAVMCWADTPG